jgi:hypothetical protein
MGGGTGLSALLKNMNPPYAPPNSGLGSDPGARIAHRRRKFWLRTIWIALAGIVVPPLLGVAGTVTGMVGALDELSEHGTADVRALGEHVSVALRATAWGTVISLLAFLLLIVALIRFFTLPKPVPRNRAGAQVEQGDRDNRL